ncbi:ATP-binding protein [Hymenobacter humi]|uniref:histidine kinase n=1 Tax=Hymenobacter humi TaxID=1411620 RepID=A0ABW2UFX0_9BACT
MQKATERFRRTIEQLTDVSKLQQAHGQPVTEVQLAAVVEEVRLDLLPLVEQTQARLIVDVPLTAHLPFSEKNLRSVVYNLLSNALKYHHPDRAPHIQLNYERQEQYHVLRVQDNGLGLDLGKAAGKLFGMFQRLHSHVDGSGIGLYMVRKMVENSGGRIEVASQLGEGSTFTVFFRYTRLPDSFPRLSACPICPAFSSSTTTTPATFSTPSCCSTSTRPCKCSRP